MTDITSPKKANSIGDLIEHDFLEEIFGPIHYLEKQPLKTTGFSGSAHEKITLHLKNEKIISLVLKLIYPANDMTIWRSGNIFNREVLLLEDAKMS